MPKKLARIKIKKEELRPRERAPILPSKKFEDKRGRPGRPEKYKKDPRKLIDDEG